MTISPQNSDKVALQVSERLARVISLHTTADDKLPNYITKYLELRKNSLFQDEIIPVSSLPLTVIGEAPKGLVRGESPVAAMLWCWNNFLCPMYTLTLWWKINRRSKSFSLRLFLPADSREFQSFLNNETQIFLIRNKKRLTSLTLKANELDGEFWKLLDNSHPHENVGDVNAAKILINSSIKKPHTPVEMLQSGWAKRLDQQINTAVRFYRDPTLDEQRKKEITEIKQSTFADYFSTEGVILSCLYSTIQERYANPDLNLIELINSANEELAEASIHKGFVNLIMECAWFSSSRTKCGLNFMSLELNGNLKVVDIDTKALADKVNKFWDRLPLRFPLYYSQLFGDGSCPADPVHFFNSLPSYEGDIDEGWNFVRDLLAEATSLKKWTIPFGAYVQLDIGKIKAVKVFEVGNDVACVFINQEEEYFLVWANPLEENFAFTHQIEMGFFAGAETAKKSKLSHLKDGQYQQEAIDRLQLSMVIPLAAIIRDFWVVEERFKIFGAAKAIREITKFPNKSKTQPIVYLPRVRYIDNIKRLAEPLHLKTRRPHFVTGHLRRAAEASEKQIFLARKYGIIVPDGFTFVRPHRRGDEAQKTVYRSRSALQCIRALMPISGSHQKDAWFTFELNVRNWLQRNGFEVEHLAGSRNGDGGVDIQACKGKEVLLIQCKYWHTTKIGPSVIRELMGTLQTFPKGSKGVLVTSTELTNGAQKLALNNGIEFLQNINFKKKINFKLN